MPDAVPTRVKGIAVPFRFTTCGYPEAVTGLDVLTDSLFTILSTTPGERVMRPTFGAWLKRLIFDNINTATAFRARTEINRAIRQWEPRAIVTGINFSFDKETGKINVTLTYRANGQEGVTTVGLETTQSSF